MNNTLIYVLSIEGGLLILAIIVFVIYEISIKHPNAFKLPKFLMPKFPHVAKNSFLDKLKQDFSLIYKPIHPEFFTSPDGNTLYLSARYTNDWLPAQVVLFMLAKKQEFLNLIEMKDPAVFESVNTLVTKLSQATIQVAYKKMNYLPSFQKNMLVWKLPLIETPEVNLAQDIIVKEL